MRHDNYNKKEEEQMEIETSDTKSISELSGINFY